ncbi:hypothetical protein ACT3SP_17980 [Brachybacterium sp. AOP43-C2-M15]|uniref:hypothetical protein n=1 Tax=Brachybacterium sp. AOP43-C2-M15 TaxID=3457661 RepID=UPI004034773C
MTSTPMHHPDDDGRPHPEDQGEDTSSSTGTGQGEDLVDEETKKLSQEEAQRHDDVVEAQKDDADQGGYGH